ncbi:MAG: PLP-dependent transferase, partial [Solirubrobacteraceae bacterium]
QEANARAITGALRTRDDVTDVRWPEVGSVVCFDVGSAERADAMLAACEVIAEATSFGGVHSNAERRARWGTDAVSEGYIRLSAGIEAAADLVADLERALSLSRP